MTANATPAPRVQVFPSPAGTVLLVGMTSEGVWVSQSLYLAEDFRARGEEFIVAMEALVKTHERPGLQLMG